MTVATSETLDTMTDDDRAKIELILDKATALTTAALHGGHLPHDRTDKYLSERIAHLSNLYGIDVPSVSAEPEAVAQPVIAPVEKPVPAVPVKKSITPDFIICLEDGKKLKMLKRHLMSHYQMTPDEYRSKWELPYDYPMVAPNYAESRRELAKKIGLGRKPSKSTTPAPAPASSESSDDAEGTTAESPVKRGRKPKVAEPA